MQDNNPHHDNKFFSGFLIGLIIGAAAIFLLGTKRGKKILKTISEGGLENIVNALEEMEEEEITDQDFVEDVSKPVKVEKEEKKSEEQVPEAKKTHRFFKKKK